MKLSNKILEAVNRGIQLALDDFEDNEPIGSLSQHNDIIDNEDVIKQKFELQKHTVDFNLPSGNLWYKCNLGATNPTESATWPHEWWGDFYAWGETEPKNDYTAEKYKFARLTYLKNTTMIEYTKYCHDIQDGYKGYTDNLTQLEPEDDVVHAKFGKNYWIPSKEDFEELFKYTKQDYVVDYCHIKDLNGVLFTSNNDKNKSIFIPCAGLRCGKRIWNPAGTVGIGYEVHLWTSSFNGNNTGRALSIEGKQHVFDDGLEKCKISNDEHRFCGLPVRPVYRDKIKRGIN